MTTTSPSIDADGLIADIAKKEGFEGELPTLADIQGMAIPTPEPESNIAITSTGATYKVITTRGMIHGTVRVTGGIVIQSQEVIGDSASDWDPLPMLPFVDKRDLPTVMASISRHIIRTAGEPSIDQVEWLHTLWKRERLEVSCEIDHPLEAWSRRG